MLNEFKVRWHINASEDLVKKTSRSAKLAKASRNTKKVMLLQYSVTVKKIISRHKTTATNWGSHDSTASFVYAESQESQACTWHLERVWSIWVVTFGGEGSLGSTSPHPILLFLQKHHRQLVQFSKAYLGSFALRPF